MMALTRFLRWSLGHLGIFWDEGSYLLFCMFILALMLGFGDILPCLEFLYLSCILYLAWSHKGGLRLVEFGLWRCILGCVSSYRKLPCTASRRDLFSALEVFNCPPPTQPVVQMLSLLSMFCSFVWGLVKSRGWLLMITFLSILMILWIPSSTFSGQLLFTPFLSFWLILLIISIFSRILWSLVPQGAPLGLLLKELGLM